MRDKWVDNPDYFGPDRRRRSGQKRWSERRKRDEGKELPALGQLLRRVRVQLTGLATPEERKHALQLLSAAIGEAQRQRLHQCVRALQDADHALRVGGAGARAAADASLVEAMNLAATERLAT